MFKLEIRTRGEAFGETQTACRAELARLLRLAADALEAGTSGAPLHDSDGNPCGRFDLRDPLRRVTAEKRR